MALDKANASEEGHCRVPHLALRGAARCPTALATGKERFKVTAAKEGFFHIHEDFKGEAPNFLLGM